VTVGAVAALLVLMWTPPLVEQATRSPGNLTKLASFFRASHPEFDRGIDHSLGRVTGQVAAELTVLPFGHDLETKPTDPAKLFVAAVGVVAAAAVAVAGWRRRRPVVAVLGAMSVIGPLVAVWSGTRIVGESFPYLLVWTSPLLLPATIGGGALLLPRPRKLVTGAAVVVGLGLTVTMARHPLVPHPSSADVGAAVRLVKPWLANHGDRQVRVRIAQHDQWPLATGVAVRLDKDGLKATADQEWTFLFGDHFSPTSHETAEIWVAETAAEPPGAIRLNRLGTVGTASIWVGPLSPP
jgi:hypothetical protein